MEIISESCRESGYKIEYGQKEIKLNVPLREDDLRIFDSDSDFTFFFEFLYNKSLIPSFFLFHPHSLFLLLASFLIAFFVSFSLILSQIFSLLGRQRRTRPHHRDHRTRKVQKVSKGSHQISKGLSLSLFLLHLLFDPVIKKEKGREKKSCFLTAFFPLFNRKMIVF